ncbi:unnamed protein product [marine sediment metagenome]|uniref:ATP-grasp domain-containing protein n=1 Tax=marine sediment metagenome TaxID=412755 RepID=X0YY55_9ZZZZ
MKLYEYESKIIFKKEGIPIPEGYLASTPDEVEKIADNLKKEVAIKAQVLATGRGKARGISFAKNPKEARQLARKIFSLRIRGFEVRKVLVEERLFPSSELFLGITYDLSQKTPVIISSSLGGIDINEIAKKYPEKVFTLPVNMIWGIQNYQGKLLAKNMGLKSKDMFKAAGIAVKLFNIFKKYDCDLAEINPLILTQDGKLIAADAHLELEQEALYRHKELEQLGIPIRKDSPRIPTKFEIEAEKIDKIDHRGVAGRVVEFDGDLGLLIGGGGASLTIFDAIRYHGGKPANYCEIGGNPTVKKVKELTKLILKKPGIKGLAVITNVLNNTRVDLVARGVILAMVELDINLSEYPILFRSAGAYEEDGYKILKKYKIKYMDRSYSIDQAAKAAVEMIS